MEEGEEGVSGQHLVPRTPWPQVSHDSLWRDSCRLSLAWETSLSSPPQELAVPIRLFLAHLPPRSCLPSWRSTGVPLLPAGLQRYPGGPRGSVHLGSIFYYNY